MLIKVEAIITVLVKNLNRINPIIKYCVLLLFFLSLAIVIVPLIVPLKEEFEFNTDEGIELMRAFLYSQGFSPHIEIWSDHPFVFSALLSFWFKVVGQSVSSGRLFTLLFSALLIWFFYEIIRTYLGHISAFFGALLLAASQGFIRYSVAVMIGVPSLSLVIMSVYALVQYKQKKHNLSLLILSAGLLALSLQIKLFAVFLIPIILLFLLDFQDFRLNNIVRELKQKKKYAHILLYLTTLSIIFCLISLLFNAFNQEQLLGTHFSQETQQVFQNSNGFNVLQKQAIKDWDLLLMACLGILIIFIQRRWEGLFPLAWLVMASLLLFNHNPVWTHHYLVLSIPLAWLATYGTIPFIQFFRKQPSWFDINQLFRSPKILIVVLSGILIITTLTRLKPKIDVPSIQRDLTPQFAVIDVLSEHKNLNQWVFTDAPIYAFYADLLVPPEIAVFSYKRVKTGQLKYEVLYNVLRDYRPEQIILSRMKKFVYANKQINNYIQENYSRQSLEYKKLDYYILNESK